MVEKDYAGDLMPSVIVPDLNMTLARALKSIMGYCNKHAGCKDGCKLWDDDSSGCLMRTYTPPCDWESIIKTVEEQEDE